MAERDRLLSSPPATVNPLFKEEASSSKAPLSSALHMLSAQWRKFEGEKVSWRSEREKLQTQIKECEEEIRKQDDIRKQLFDRLKRLETEYQECKTGSPSPSASPPTSSPPFLVSSPQEQEEKEVQQGTGERLSWTVSPSRVTFPPPSQRPRREGDVPAPAPLPLSLSKEFVASLSKQAYQGVLGMVGGSSSNPFGTNSSGSSRRAGLSAMPSLVPASLAVEGLGGGTSSSSNSSSSSTKSAAAAPAAATSGVVAGGTAGKAGPRRARRASAAADSVKRDAAWKRRFVTMKSHQQAVRVIAFFEKLPFLFTGGDEGFVLVWNLDPFFHSAGGGKLGNNGKMSPKFNVSVHEGPIVGLVPLESTEEMISGSADGVVHRWRVQEQEDRNSGGRVLDVTGGRTLLGLEGHQRSRVMAVMVPGQVLFWGISGTGSPSPVAGDAGEDREEEEGQESDCLVGPALDLLQQGRSSCANEVLLQSAELQGDPCSVAFLVGQPSLRAVIGTSSSVQLFDVSTGSVLWQHSPTGPSPLVRVSSAGSDKVVFAHQDQHMVAVSAVSGDEVTQWVAHSGSIFGVDYCEEHELVASGDSESSLRFWTLPDAKCAKEFELRCQGKGISSLRFHPSNLFLATGCGNGQVMIFQFH